MNIKQLFSRALKVQSTSASRTRKLFQIAHLLKSNLSQQEAFVDIVRTLISCQN